MTEEIQLKNGCTILIKELSHAQSVSIGLFVRTGIELEPLHLNGITHFLEHMSFKGTFRRNAKRIAEELDIMGGEMNALTSKEYICYYMTLLPQWLEKGLDLLADIFLNAKLENSDLQTERKVILEEINMYEDTPDEKVHDLFAHTIWKNHPLGLPVLGTKESLKRINRSDMDQFRNTCLDPNKIIISVAGKIKNKNKLIKMVQSFFSDLKSMKKNSQKKEVVPPTPLYKTVKKNKDTEQIHLCLGSQCIPYCHPDIYKLSLLNIILGGTMSSRLFQNIREKKGVAYSIFSYISFHKSASLWVIYAGLTKSKYDQTFKAIFKETESLKSRPVSQKELKKAKEHFKGNLLIDLERSKNWMSWQARSKILMDRIPTLKEVIKKIDVVTPADIQFYAQKCFEQKNLAIAAIGPFIKNKTVSQSNED